MPDTYSDNLRIPHLEQNTAEPEIPENTAKDIIDKLLTNTYVLDTIDDLDITIVHADSTIEASNWQSFIIKITDTGVLLTGGINVILPDNMRPYIFVNSTLQALTFKTSAGTGFSLQADTNGYGYCDGINIEKLEFAASGAGATIESLTDSPTGYGTAGQALITNGTNSFTFQDVISSIGESTDVTAGYGSAGQILVTNGSDAFIYVDLPSGGSLEGPNQITDDAGVDFGFIFTGTADIDFATSATTGTGMMYGTQGFVAIKTDIEFFNIDPSISETLMLGTSTKVTHADDSVTTLNNPEWIAQNAQRTADIALKNTMDINMAINTLAKASKITLIAIGSETGAGEYTFAIAP